MSPSATSPVIIIGMHRSGTSLLTRVLQQAGFFMGRGTSRNEEAAFTNAINAWLFRQASATWDCPESMDLLLADQELRPWLRDYIGGIIRGPAALRFLGLKRGLRGGGLPAQCTPWGWKDPRNTFTLPLWLELFPEARVLHIVRHGVDVAASLRRRRQEEFAARVARYRRRRRWTWLNPLAPKHRGFGPQVRCRTLEGGFELWQLYVERAMEHVQFLGGQALTIKYEALLTDPLPNLRQALDFCGCVMDESSLRAVAAGFRSERVHAWSRLEELREFTVGHQPTLAMYGYPALRESQLAEGTA
ncbi:sulfotransferase family protein [Desulfurivibrio dismutans]|uniref:sulfotransferase family protein n=1 Tax=Desulfurivibrio dismutans TaxID=1398908 RepID=UPI0023DBB6F3|nr:sulfotransferase [Desulfurivibrio alkaliphilus]MDF1614759.1 sulfotransferase [Desulfurivibrio alkaliphilus]